jgi:raffinose/stachyose/melibiose transport system permease protein
MAAVASQLKKARKINAPRIIQYVVLSIITIIVVVPIVILIFGSLKTSGEMYSRPYTIPNPVHWENYIQILAQSTFWRMLGNSLIVMTFTTVSVLIICSMAAFTFARMRFRGQALAFNFLTLGLMFPITVAILPVFLVMRDMHLTNSLLAVVIVQTAFGISGNIMILNGFFKSIPTELQDASYIDGCTPIGFFWMILLPLARPALSAVAALTMIVSWNDLLTPLVLTDSESLWTLPLGTMQFQGQYGQDLALVAAFVTLSALPMILFYFFAEKQIVSGLTAGALKG